MADRALAGRNAGTAARLLRASLADHSFPKTCYLPGIQLVTCVRPRLWHCKDAACRVPAPNTVHHDYIGRKNRPNPEVVAPPGRRPALLACALVRARRRTPAERERFRRPRPRRSRSRTAAPAGRTRIALRMERTVAGRLNQGRLPIAAPCFASLVAGLDSRFV